jgi:hypothetical protein
MQNNTAVKKTGSLTVTIIDGAEGKDIVEFRPVATQQPQNKHLYNSHC